MTTQTKKEGRIISPYVYKKNKATPNTPIFEKQNLFKFVQVDKIREPLKLLTFIEWLAIPPVERQLKTQQELAIKIGVNVDTLADWKKLLGFWDEVSIYRNQYFRKYTTSVFYGLVKRAQTGDPRSAELFLSIFEGFNKGIVIEDMTPPRIITDEEKAKIDHALKNIGLASIIKHSEESEGNDSIN